MAGTEFSLELQNIFFSGQVEPASCFQTMFGSIQTGLILKDVSLDVKSGEVLAVLGSKGSGKKALLEVISKRSDGPVRGHILLDRTPMTAQLFQRTSAYVSHRTELMPTISVEQTLNYYAELNMGSKLSPYLKKMRVKQVLADLALSQIARWNISRLNSSEHRRVVIGSQLIKDPMLLLLDDLTADLDPLTTYLIVSMLSNYAKRRSRIVVLTMEKPRSDVFPFLDRVAYLCLGDVVYTGPTRLMLEYFKAIGFPCPQLENPLMYYLCLSTVDRRSRERFIESNTQIVALVEKFKVEGNPYRKSSSLISGHLLVGSPEQNSMVPRKISYSSNFSSFSQPSSIKIAYILFKRLFCSTFCLNYQAFCLLMMRLISLPIFFAIVWFFYRNMHVNLQITFYSHNGLLFTCMAGTYILSVVNTAYVFPMHRNNYYEESRQGLYSGPLFLFTYWLHSIFFSSVTVALSALIIFKTTGLKNSRDYYSFAAIIWGMYMFAEQQTIALMMVIRSSFASIVSSFYLSVIFLILGSGALRSYSSLSDWLYYLSYSCQTRYASAFLNGQVFGHNRLSNLSYDVTMGCAKFGYNSEQFVCRYADGNAYLSERYSRGSPDIAAAPLSEILDPNFNLIATVLFPLLAIIFNCGLYLMPLPSFIKNKFRD